MELALRYKKKVGSGLSLSHSAMPRQNVIMKDLTLEVMLEVMPHDLGGDPTSRLARTDGG